MKIKTLLALSLIVSSFGLVHGQGFTPPWGDNAVVYFARVSDYGFAVSFEYFHQDKYIGAFKGKNYMRYELEPGQQLLWASSENKEFLTADLLPGGTYIVIVDVVIGFWKGHVGFTPISVNESELFERAKALINSEPPVEIPQEDIVKMNKKLSKFIPEMLERYENEWKQEHNFRHISPEMAIPEDRIK
jgi:hypothetical protein